MFFFCKNPLCPRESVNRTSYSELKMYLTCGRGPANSVVCRKAIYPLCDLKSKWNRKIATREVYVCVRLERGLFAIKYTAWLGVLTCVWLTSSVGFCAAGARHSWTYTHSDIYLALIRSCLKIARTHTHCAQSFLYTIQPLSHFPLTEIFQPLPPALTFHHIFTSFLKLVLLAVYILFIIAIHRQKSI